VPSLTRPPIREALIDLRCALPGGKDEDLLARLECAHETIKHEFPIKTRSYAASVSAQLTESPTIRTSGTTELRGFCFHHPNENKIVQVRLDGFTLNKLRPYTSWKDLRTEARSIWETYGATVEDAAVTRVGVRYINEVLIPPGVGFGAIFEEPMRKPLGLPRGQVRESLEQLHVSDPAGREWANVTRLVKARGAGLSVIFDIDVYTLAEGGAFSTREAWERIEGLRNRKNKVFFASLTQDGLEQFK